MSDLYRDFIDQKADQIITDLGGTITPAPVNAELYRDFLDRKVDDVINAIGNVKVKSFTYIGDGANPASINFPETPKCVLGIFGISANSNRYFTSSFCISNYLVGVVTTYIQPTITSATSRCGIASYDTTTNILSLENQYSTYAMNNRDEKYIVYYI